MEEGFPGAAFQARERVFLRVPPVEVAHQTYRLRRGSVFTEPPSFLLRVVVETEVAVSAGEIPQAVAMLFDKAHVLTVPLQAVFQVLCIGGEPGVVAYDGQGLFSRFFFFFHLGGGFSFRTKVTIFFRDKQRVRMLSEFVGFLCGETRFAIQDPERCGCMRFKRVADGGERA